VRVHCNPSLRASCARAGSHGTNFPTAGGPLCGPSPHTPFSLTRSASSWMWYPSETTWSKCSSSVSVHSSCPHGVTCVADRGAMRALVSNRLPRTRSHASRVHSSQGTHRPDAQQSTIHASSDHATYRLQMGQMCQRLVWLVGAVYANEEQRYNDQDHGVQPLQASAAWHGTVCVPQMPFRFTPSGCTPLIFRKRGHYCHERDDVDLHGLGASRCTVPTQATPPQTRCGRRLTAS
jgi:hypothetical protein